MIDRPDPLVNASENFERPGLSYDQGRYSGFNPFFSGNQEATLRPADWNWLTLHVGSMQSSIQAGASISTAGQTFQNIRVLGLSMPDMTLGSVLFIGANNQVSQNNSSFFWDNTNIRLSIGSGVFSDTLRVVGKTFSSGTPDIVLRTVGAPSTGLSAAEVLDVYFKGARNVQFTTGGVLGTQRSVVFDAPTFTATAATQTIMTAATVAVAAAPAAGLNVAITNPYAFWVQAGNIGFSTGSILHWNDTSPDLTLSRITGNYGIAAMARQAVTNSLGQFAASPNGTVAGTAHSLFRAFMTDINADNTNFESVDLEAHNDTFYYIKTRQGGTGVHHDLRFQIGGRNLQTWRQGSSITTMNSTVSFGWNSANDLSGTDDTLMVRDGAPDTFAFQRAANAQTVRWYNTFTDATHFERLEISAASAFGANTYGILVNASNGTYRPLYIGSLGGSNLIFVANGSGRWQVDTSGFLVTMAALATNMTTGFINIPGAAGPPTGVPATTTGFPVYYDSTADQVNFYNGSWKAIQAGKPILASYTSADQTITNSTTLTNTGQTVNVLAGKIYKFHVVIFETSASVTAGISLAIAGTCTATSIKYEAFNIAGTPILGRAAALGTRVDLAVGAGDNYIEINGTIEVNAAGTLTTQFAQRVADAVNATLFQRNSVFEVLQVG